jgi:DNA-directed RNA polymerase subunit beta'
MRAVDVLVNSSLPDDLKDYDRVYDKKGVGDLMALIAKNHPEKYRELSKKVSDYGRMASYLQGETLTLSDMRPTFDKTSELASLQEELAVMKKTLPRSKHEKARIQLFQKYADRLSKKTLKSTVSGMHGLANTVFSGARGNPTQLNAMITTPGIYTDYQDKPIEIFVNNSFGEGLRPYEYLAGMFGARKSVIATKEATADAGYLGKQMARATLPIVVTQNTCNSNNGIMVETDDIDNLLGRVTVTNHHGVKAGTVIDRPILNHLVKNKAKKLMVKSPLTCQAKEGVCAECGGTDSSGKFAKIGDTVGLTAAQAISEPLTQGSLNTKHTGGIYGGKKSFGGFSVINQIMQAPSTFPNRATVAEITGKVEKIEKAPQGGSFITVGPEKHYVLPGFDPLVKKGDLVELGDPLSDGIVDVKDVVRLRGLGEGRKYYVDRLHQAFEDSGMRVSKRNLEYLARGALDQVQVNDIEGMGDALPDDLVSYNKLISDYNPPKNSQMLPLDKAHGTYLQMPILHYSIGTKLTPNMIKNLKESGVGKIYTSEETPKFTPIMTMLARATKHEEDWLAKMHTTYLAESLKNDSAMGADTNINQNLHFAPRLAVGSNFGERSRQTGKF